MGSSRNKPRAFTLIELLVVVSIIVLLIALLLPTLGRARYEARSVNCATKKRQIASGLNSYAQDNFSYYPARGPSSAGSNLPFWWGRPGATGDMHAVADEYFGGSPGSGTPPSLLLCEVAPKAIWGVEIAWPLSGIYRTNVSVTGGWNWRIAPPNQCVPMLSLDQMPLRSNQQVHRPIAFDLIEHMTGNSTNGYTGWAVGHQFNPRYHVRSKSGPETPPPDPIPFAYSDGSVRMTNELESVFLDPGWGIKYWAAE